MPFKSEAQKRFMYSQHPDIAKRWTAKYGAKPVGKKMKSAAKRRMKKADG